MKKQMTFKILIIAALFVCNHSFATNSWVDKQKTITKTIPIKTGQKVSITNSFGRVNVFNGNTNTLTVSVTIKVSSASEKTAQEIMDGIQIEERTENNISFETKFGNKSNRSKGDNSKMEVNYDVTLPSSTPLYVKNSFGNTDIPDREGVTELTQSFGKLTTGQLLQLTKVDVEFGKLASEGITGSKIKSSYSDVNIKKLAGNVKGSFEFCKKINLDFSKSIGNITINSSYSDLKINLPQNFDANFNVKTSFGKVFATSVKLIDETKENQYTPTFDRKYSGKTGSGKSTIIILSNFGDVKID